MNKLDLSVKDIKLNNDNYFFEVSNETHQNFEVDGDNKLVIVGNDCNLYINFVFSDNSSLIINCIGKNMSLNIKASLFENSKLISNYGVISNNDSVNNYEIYHIGNRCEL